MQFGIDVSNRPPAQGTLADLVPENIFELLEQRPITMLPTTKDLSPENLRSIFPTGTIYICDAYVEGIERGHELPYGYERDGIVNIDHHAPSRAMMRKVSSGNLALEFLKHHRPLTADEHVVIHHLDCDSFTSSLLLRGILKPSPLWAQTVIAADHTGEPNPVADLLQGVSENRDMRLSAENLLRLSRGKELEPEAQRGLADRASQRAAAKQAAESGMLQKTDGLTWFVTDKNIDGELVVPLIPDAVVIMVAVPFEGKPGTWVNRLRLGLAAPEGLSLLDLGINDFNSTWGGRWNAGSNNRGGGSELAPEEYARLLAGKIQHWIVTNLS
jgi:hypothetical protein